MPNTPEFDALSIEAKVIVGAWWGLMLTSEVKFDRPWIIHPRTRKGLNDLVEAGYLTAGPINHYKDAPWAWQPTEKLKSERPRVSADFLKDNSFPITDETQPKATIAFATGPAAPHGLPTFTLTPATLLDLQPWLATLPWPLAAWARAAGADTIVDLVPEDSVDLKRKTVPHPGAELVTATILLPGVPYGDRLLAGDGARSNRTPLIHALQNALAAHCCGFSVGFSNPGTSLWAHSCISLPNRPLSDDVTIRREAYAAAVKPIIDETAQRYGKGWRYSWPKTVA